MSLIRRPNGPRVSIRPPFPCTPQLGEPQSAPTFNSMERGLTRGPLALRLNEVARAAYNMRC